jgi:hypothetical protein
VENDKCRFGLKALIAILVLGVMLVLGVVGAGVYWWSRNKDELLARGKAQIEEGREAGRATDNQGCVDRSVERYKRDPGLTSGITSSIFMQACLDASSATPGFCDDVPETSEIMKSAQWRVDQCQRVDLSSDRYCQQLFAPVQSFCERSARGNRGNENSNAP